MFDLPKVRYIEGAPWEWRRWLTPGVDIALRIGETGIEVFGAGGHEASMGWADVTSLEARGPDAPERRDGVDPYKSVARGTILGGWLIGAILGALAFRRPKEKYCWLAVGLASGGEMIVEVVGMVRHELQATLEAHSG